MALERLPAPRKGPIPGIGRQQDMAPSRLVLRPFGLKLAKAVPLTWEEISELEPRVLVLLDQIKSERPTMRNFLGIWLKYLEQFSAIVGFRREDATHPELRSETTYKTVYEKLVSNFGTSE
jgi:hypothetical protein